MHNRVDDGADLTRRTWLAMAAMVPALAVAGTTRAAASSASASDEVPRDLAKALRDYDQATIRNDTATLADLVADDYVLVNSDTTLQNKQEYLADFNVPGFKIDPYVVEQPLAKVWGTAALTGGLMTLGWTQDGRHQSRRLRIAHVWVEQGGRWRIAYTQLTRVPH